jgi:uncharacterized protein (DUF488 family)
MKNPPVYTIGYGARDIDAFCDVLRRYEIAYLVDVRSRPYSRYKPDFSKDALAQHLERAGIRYIFLGDALGGLPPDRSLYEGDLVIYERVAEQPFYKEGITRVKNAWKQGLPLVLMCSEGRPEQCHRSKLIAFTLEGQGVPVAHIDESDQLISQRDVDLRLKGGQPSLFGSDFDRLTSRKRYPGDDAAGADDGH